MQPRSGSPPAAPASHWESATARAAQRTGLASALSSPRRPQIPMTALQTESRYCHRQLQEPPAQPALTPAWPPLTAAAASTTARENLLVRVRVESVERAYRQTSRHQPHAETFDKSFERRRSASESPAACMRMH